jgi:hypothetical protein
MAPPAEEIPDASAAYRLWDELFQSCLKIALSTANGTPQEKEEAWSRLLRGQELAHAERDAMWRRIFARLEAAERGD